MNNGEYAKNTRHYFENGCKCMLVNKTLAKLPPEIPDQQAALHYLKSCRCSRNFESDGFLNTKPS